MIRTYVAQVHTGYEQQAADQIRKIGIMVYALEMLQRKKILPGMTWRQKQNIRTNPTKIIPLFPGYVIVQFDAKTDYWFPILRQPFVVGLVPMVDERPQPMPIGAAERLLDCIGADGYWSEEQATKNAMRPWEKLKGNIVEVMDGPFTTFKGLCEETDDGRIKVLLNMFGRDQPITLDWQQVELA